jgi:hypothetical protein
MHCTKLVSDLEMCSSTGCMQTGLVEVIVNVGSPLLCQRIRITNVAYFRLATRQSRISYQAEERNDGTEWRDNGAEATLSPSTKRYTRNK